MGISITKTGEDKSDFSSNSTLFGVCECVYSLRLDLSLGLFKLRECLCKAERREVGRQDINKGANLPLVQMDDS